MSLFVTLFVVYFVISVSESNIVYEIMDAKSLEVWRLISDINVTTWNEYNFNSNDWIKKSLKYQMYSNEIISDHLNYSMILNDSFGNAELIMIQKNINHTNMDSNGYIRTNTYQYLNEYYYVFDSEITILTFNYDIYWIKMFSSLNGDQDKIILPEPYSDTLDYNWKIINIKLYLTDSFEFRLNGNVDVIIDSNDNEYYFINNEMKEEVTKLLNKYIENPYNIDYHYQHIFALDKSTVFFDLEPSNVLRVRRNYMELCDDEKQRILFGLMKMKEVPSRFNAEYNSYDYFVMVYAQSLQTYQTFDKAHASFGFLPWNRIFLYILEKELQSILNDTTFSLPYWNFTDEYQRNSVLNDSIFGGYPIPYNLNSDVFQLNKKLVGIDLRIYDTLQRNIGEGLSETLDGKEYIYGKSIESWKTWENIVNTNDIYDSYPYFSNSKDWNMESYNHSFRAKLEGCNMDIPNGECYDMYGGAKLYFGGHFASGFTINDPLSIFFHVFIDVLWSMYQNRMDINISNNITFPLEYIDHQISTFFPFYQFSPKMVINTIEHCNYVYDIYSDINGYFNRRMKNSKLSSIKYCPELNTNDNKSKFKKTVNWNGYIVLLLTFISWIGICIIIYYVYNKTAHEIYVLTYIGEHSLNIPKSKPTHIPLKK